MRKPVQKAKKKKKKKKYNNKSSAREVRSTDPKYLCAGRGQKALSKLLGGWSLLPPSDSVNNILLTSYQLQSFNSMIYNIHCKVNWVLKQAWNQRWGQLHWKVIH